MALWCGLPRRRPLRDAALLGQVELALLWVRGSVKVNVLPWPGSLSTREAAAVELDEASRDGETQTRALLEVGRPDLLELLENAGLVRRRDTDAVVAHADHHVVAIGTRADTDMTTRGCELQSVGEQVEEHLLDHPLVRLDDPDVRFDVEPQAMPSRVARSRNSATEFCTTSESAKGVTCRSILPASILERSRMSLISASRWRPEVWISATYSACLSLSSPNSRSRQHLRETDHGVEWGAQLVRHVGEELRLVPARVSSSAYSRPSSSFMRLRFVARAPSSSRLGTSTWPEKSPEAMAASRVSIFWIGPTSDRERSEIPGAGQDDAPCRDPDEEVLRLRVGTCVAGDQIVGVRNGGFHEPLRELQHLGGEGFGRPVLQLLSLACLFIVVVTENLRDHVGELIGIQLDPAEEVPLVSRGHEVETCDV